MLESLAYPALLIASLGLILFACELFTNGIEWTGRKLKLSDGATGSILAAVGTALPETSIPIIALMAGKAGGADIAVGAIAGAPFMLATLGFFVTGTAVFYFTRKGRRGLSMKVDTTVITRDLGFFLVIYTAAFVTTFIPGHHTLRLVVAICLASSYGYYTWVTLRHAGHSDHELDELHLSKFFHLDNHSGFIAVQVLASLGLIVMGAHLFVVAVEHVSAMFGVPAMLLSLLITPVATELPEKMNSVLWIKGGKDTLAIGNITGAMVFQASFPVAIGVAFTPWALSGPTMVSAVIAIFSAGVCYISLKRRKSLSPAVLLTGGAFYLAFIAYLFV